MKVTLIDAMGTDLTVANAARVSFNKESTYNYSEGFPKLEERDQKLIKYLASHNHFTPFTHCMVTMREKVPMFVARQRFKHVIGFTYNEVSRRYVDDKPEFFEPEQWRKRAENKKQGSSDETIDLNDPNVKQDHFFHGVADQYKPNIYDEVTSTCMRVYNQMILRGVCPEQARMVLPQSTYTEYYVTGSLYAWARAFNLRSKADAQKEIQDLAWMWDEIMMDKFPYSWTALTEEGV
jgi:thymidylate synthase (FAD)